MTEMVSEARVASASVGYKEGGVASLLVSSSERGVTSVLISSSQGGVARGSGRVCALKIIVFFFQCFLSFLNFLFLSTKTYVAGTIGSTFMALKAPVFCVVCVVLCHSLCLCEYFCVCVCVCNPLLLCVLC